MENFNEKTLDSLTAANKRLREERKKLNLDSVEGKKRIHEINAELDKNNSKIKENVSALEKQKINVGNYKSALDGVHPALGQVATGLESGTSCVHLFGIYTKCMYISEQLNYKTF